MNIEYERSVLGWKAKTQMPNGEVLTAAVRSPVASDATEALIKALKIRKARGEFQ